MDVEIASCHAEPLWKKLSGASGRRHEEGQHRADTKRTRALRARRRPLVTKGRPRRWLVVVAREEDEIHAKLRRVLAADRHARVIFDWRATAARNPPWVTRSLRTHGFAVIPAVGKGRQNSHRAAAAG